MTENKRYTAIISSMGTSRNYCTGIKDNDFNDELTNIYEVLRVMNGLDGTVKSLIEDYGQLLKKNKELKQFKQQVINLIDEKIKELKNINNVSIIPRESIEVLEQLKKELSE